MHKNSHAVLFSSAPESSQSIGDTEGRKKEKYVASKCDQCIQDVIIVGTTKSCMTSNDLLVAENPGKYSPLNYFFLWLSIQYIPSLSQGMYFLFSIFSCGLHYHSLNIFGHNIIFLDLQI